METKSPAAAGKSALKSIFTIRNGVAAGLVTSVFMAGSHFGFEQYENILESRGMDTLPEAENIFYPVTEDGNVDWDEMKADTVRMFTFDFD